MADETNLVDKLRQQRDRFIAFAFAGADMLIEMRDDAIVSYSAGAGEALHGLNDRDLVGRPFKDFVHPRDMKLLEEALQRLHNSGRLDQMTLSLMGQDGAVARMRLSGIRLPQMSCSHLALGRMPTMAEGEVRGRNGDSKTRFVEMVRQRLNEASRAGHELTLTLVDLSATDFAALDATIAHNLLATVQNALDGVSVGGASAGALTDRTFGVLHHPDTPPHVVEENLRQVGQKLTAKGNTHLKLRSNSLSMKNNGLNDEDITKALAFIVNTYLREGARFAITSLEEGAQTALEDTAVRVKNFRNMLRQDKLQFLFQPAVNIRTGAVLSFEAFTRINHNNALFTPTQILPFAADAGVIGEMDTAVCRKALTMMGDPKTVSPLAHVSVNISSHSLVNPIFFRNLQLVLDQHKPRLGRLILEITDTATISNLDEARRLLTRLRAQGVRISLDDMGSGTAAIDLLRALPVDFAKIDRFYITDATTPKGLAVLKAIASLCRDIGVVAVAECVEDAKTLSLISDVGIDYAQGYYFEKPNAEAAAKIRYYTEQVEQAGLASPSLASTG
jgi:EAL domain-containing protein (putative c-di-GMP-specific phosphodiesterase class I)